MKNWIIILGIVIIVAIAAVFMFGGGRTDTDIITQNTNDNLPSAQVQKVVISEKDLNYYPQQIKVKVNQPVSISLDSSVKGCLRAFTIKDFGITKYLKTPQETIDFTPNQKGTYRFACTMGMGYGTLIVE